MPNGLWTAATGMLAQQTSMDAIANNLANVNTTGFKRGRTAFQDLLYQTLTPQQAAKQGSQVGAGTRVAGIQTEFEEGAFQQTDNPLDVAIDGSGFLEVTRADGSRAYTRAGNLTTDANGTLTTVQGDVVSPRIRIPANAKDLTIGTDGRVTATVNGRTQNLGQLRLATFANPAGLSQAGDSLFTPTANSGAARLVTPGTNGAGSLQQGKLEGSNVNAVDEMVGMVSTQRAYEAVSKVVSAADVMMQMANQLRR
jgi:flagellar basal-body rod protein FlgG